VRRRREPRDAEGLSVGIRRRTEGPRDRRLGDIGGAPFSLDAEQDDRWGRPAFPIDAAPRPGEGFSLGSMLDVHFVTRMPEPWEAPDAHDRCGPE
jgi:uncharacterized protein (DUF779 family)